MQRQPPPHLARLNLVQGQPGGPMHPGGPPMFSPMLQTPLQFNAPHPFNIPGAPQRPGHRANQASMQLAAAGIVPPTPGMPLPTPGLGGHFPRPSMLGGGSFNFGEPGTPGGNNWQQKRRNKQMSIGGPPKAVLGGPQRKMSVSPMPKEADKEKVKLEEEAAKIKKKTVVKLPKETLNAEKDERQPWARYPMPLPLPEEDGRQLSEKDISSQVCFPGDEWRYDVPANVDVFLPGKAAWQKLKHRAIEEKLDKLGILAGSGSTTATNPPIWAPHARAASISSPADPALLLSKLRKLQSQQIGETSTDAGSSLASSPAPPSTMSFGHGHSQSLASNPFGPHAILGNDGLPGGPFIHAPHARAPLKVPNLNTERLTPPIPNGSHLAPPPVSAVGNATGRPSSKPDFMRGFGLDLEEVEEVDETGHSRQNSANLLDTERWVKAHSRNQSDQVQGEVEVNEPEDEEAEVQTLPSWALSHNRINSTLDENPSSPVPEQPPRSPYLHPTDIPVQGSRRPSNATTVATDTSEVPPLPSVFSGASGGLSYPPQHGAADGVHSRHVSKLSAALSLRSVGGVSAELEETRKAIVSQRVENGDVNGEMDMSIDADADEWTGSDEESENGSLGEYSNPSDEERARQERIERRRRRITRASQGGQGRAYPPDTLEDSPRRLPNFPRPPDNTTNFSLPFDQNSRQIADDDEWRSNPSDDGAPTRDFLGVSLGGTGGLAMSEFNFHSRQNSSNTHTSMHDPANAHSRINSSNSEAQGGHQARPSFAAPMPALNPFARPFSFNPAINKEVETPAWFKTSFPVSQPVAIRPPGPAVLPPESAPGAPPNAPVMGGHARLPSFGKPLNVGAPEFKPTFGAAAPVAPASVPHIRTPSSGPSFNPAAPEFKPGGASSLFNVNAVEFKPTFTFRPPPTAPSMPVPISMPQPTPVDDLGLEQQHREKRIRRSEDIEVIEDIEEVENRIPLRTKDSMTTFKFPPGPESSHGLSPLKVRNVAASPSPSVDSEGEVNEPFSLSTFQKNSLSGMPQVPRTPTDPEHTLDDRRTSLTMAMALARNAEGELDAPLDSGSEIDENVPPPHFPIPHPAPADDAASAAVPKQRRAPVPLDFKHPVSNTTVPAGLFKNLVNGGNGGQVLNGRSPSRGDDKTRKTVRSRLSSRDVFEMEHRTNPSLDDLNVPGISLSHKASGGRLGADPLAPSPIPRREDDDVFTGAAASLHVKRRSSLPDGIGNGTHRPVVADDESYRTESDSEFLGEGVSGNLAAKLAVQQMERRLDQMSAFEKRLESLFDEKIARILEGEGFGRATLEPATEERITEVLSLFRTQLQDSVSKSMSGFDDSQVDARAEIDFEMIRDMVREGHEDARNLIQSELNGLIQRLAEVQVSTAAASTSGAQSQDFGPLMEQLNARTLAAVEEAVVNSAEHLQIITKQSAARTQESIIENMTAALHPILQYARADPVDYDLLTNKLSNAVRPTLADVLDLASDKRETADLIVKQILPLLPKSTPSPSPTIPHHPAVDSDVLAQRLSQEVRQAIGPIDPFEIKEQVADLVIERLDSRLAVRDKSFSADVVSTKVLGNITNLLEPIWGQFAALKSTHEDLASQQSDVSAGQIQLLNLINALPAQFTLAVDELRAAQAATSESLSEATGASSRDPALDANVDHIKSTVDSIVGSQKSLSSNTESIISLHKDVLDKLNSLPETLGHGNNLLHAAHSDLDLARESHKREVEDLRRTNTQYQVDLAKARGAHGQVRVEKDSLAEKVKGLETDRDFLRSQVKDLDATAVAKAEETVALEARNKELQDALAQALSRLQASDVATQTNSDRISELEKTNRDLVSEKSNLKAKIDTAELQVTFAIRDKENALQSLTSLQKQQEQLISQQSHWDTLLETKQQVSMLTELMTQAEKNDLEELKRFKEQALLAEAEHKSLRQRFKDQESRITASEKNAFTARQNLTMANQRASDSEKRAKEFEAQLERVQTQLEQAEATHAQLEADYSVAKLQLQRHSDERGLAEDRERRNKDQLTNLEEKVRNLQAALAQAQAGPETSTSRRANGTARAPIRPDSRASTAYVDSRSVTPTGDISTPPKGLTGSVWDSMHAPGIRDSGYSSVSTRSSHIAAPSPVPARYGNVGLGNAKSRRPAPPSSVYSIRNAPSPTPSTATVDEDGWWQAS